MNCWGDVGIVEADYPAKLRHLAATNIYYDDNCLVMVQQTADRRSILRYGGLAGVALVAGCLGDDGDDDDADDTDPVADDTDDGDADLDSPDTLRYTSEATFETLDPRDITQTTGHAWKFLTYNSLLKVAWDEDEGQEYITGDLAEDWEWLEEDGETLVQFQIRDGVEFQNGDTVDANILADEVNYWLDPETESAQGQQTFVPGGLERASVDNDSTLNFHLEDIWAPLEEYVAYYMTLGNPNVREEMGPDSYATEGGSHGSGPYKIVEWAEGDQLVLERYDNYHEEGLPHFEQVEIDILPESSTRAARLNTGELHLDPFVSASQLVEFEDNDEIVTDTRASPFFLFNALNHDIEPLGDNRVRRALRMAIDGEAVIQTAYEGFGTPVTTVGRPGSWYYFEDIDEMNQYDPDRAQQLLEEAGWDDGFEIEMHAATLSTYQTMTQTVQAMWSEIGVDVTLRDSDYSAMFGDIAEGNFETNMGEYRNDDDPDNMAWQSIHENGRWANFSKGWHEQDPDSYNEYIEAMRDGRSVADPEERRERYRRAYEIFAEEMPMLVVGVVDSMMAYRTELGQVWHHPRAENPGEALREVRWQA